MSTTSGSSACYELQYFYNNITIHLLTSVPYDFVGMFPHWLTFVSEGFAALGTLLRLLARRWRDVLWVVVEVLVAAQELLLTE